MIADLDESIKKLLVEDLPIKNGDIDVKFDQPKREWSAKLTKPTVNFFLYDLRENGDLRQAGLERYMSNGNGQSRMKKAPHRVDCYYMMTTWAAEPEDEHRLLTRAIMSLFRNPILPSHLLVGMLRKPRFPIQTYVARHDKLTNPAEVWSALDNEMRPSINYIVTLALDPYAEVFGPIVQNYTMRTGQTSSLPTDKELDVISSERVYIGGTVRDKKKEPLAGLEVALKGTGWFGETDEQGRYQLGSMPVGDYTLVVWPKKGKPKEKKVTIPAAGVEYDLEI